MARRIPYYDYSGGVDKRSAPEKIARNMCSDISNCDIDEQGAVETRAGSSQRGDQLSSSKKILGLFAYINHVGTCRPLATCDTKVKEDVSGTWTDRVTGLTTGKAMNFVNAFGKVYMFNGTDNVQEQSGTTVTAKADIPKGTMAAFHENRLVVAGVTDHESEFYYPTLDTITYDTTNRVVDTEEKITGLLSDGFYLYISTENHIFRVRRFQVFDGGAVGPEKLEKLPVELGFVAHRSLVKIGGWLYGVARDGIYRTNGMEKYLESYYIQPDFDAFPHTYLANCSAVKYQDKYVLAVTGSGGTTNDKIYLLNSRNRVMTPQRYSVGRATIYDDLAPAVLALIPDSNGDPELHFGTDGTVGEVFELDTGTNDDGSAITAYATKPILHDVDPDLLKRLQGLFARTSAPGDWEMQIGWNAAPYSSFTEETISLKPSGILRGGFTRGDAIRGTYSKREHIIKSCRNQRGRFFLVRVYQSASADQYFKVYQLGAKFRTIRRYHL